MKTTAYFSLLLPVLLLPLCSAAGGWVVSDQLPNAFIENRSQFDSRDRLAGKILFGVDQAPLQIYFSKTGLTYRFDKREKKEIEKKAVRDAKEYEELEKAERSVKITTALVHLEWVDANPSAELEAEEQTEYYHSYQVSKDVNITNIHSFKKLLYKDLYPGVDVEYAFHPKVGIKYTLILHPGADVSKIKMKWTGSQGVSLDAEGNIHLKTVFGDIIDHAPSSFFDNDRSEVGSHFELNGSIVSFKLDAALLTDRTLVIDPWSISPSFPNSNKVWEIETDNAGNVYAYGGDMPMTLRKYNSAGALQWTYATAWDSANYWIGTLLTDQVTGESYITAGSNGEIRKISTAGASVWYNNPNGFTNSYEYWKLALNCDRTRLVCGGTRLTIFTNTIRGTMMNISLANGSLGTVTVVGYGPMFPPKIQEVSSVAWSPNGNYYFLTLDTVGSINGPLSIINYKVPTLYNFDYYIPGYGFGTKQPISAIAANGAALYTHNGVTLHKRNLGTGAVTGTAAIPNGISTTTFNGTKLPGNGGLDLDNCGNVYVGSNGQVHKYDANLNLLASAATPSAVYDVDVNNNGEVAACGNGFIASVALSACAQVTYTCTINNLGTTASNTNIYATANARARPLRHLQAVLLLMLTAGRVGRPRKPPLHSARERTP